MATRFVTVARWRAACWLAASLMAGVAAAQDLVVRIGHVAPMSGWLASVGRDSASGVRLAVETLNRQGITVGGRRVVFELILADDAGDIARSVSAGQSLVDARVSAVIGHLLSDPSIAAGAVYAHAGIVQIAPSATRVDYTRQGWNTAFRVIANDARIGRLLARHAVEERKARRFLVVDDSSAFGSGLADEFSMEVRAGGALLVERLRIDATANEFRDVLSRVQAMRADAIFFGGYDRQAGLLLKQMRRQGIDAAFIGGDAICTPDLVSYWAAGAALDDQVLCALPAGVGGIGDVGWNEFSARFRTRFGTPPEFYAPYAYDAAMVVADAMVRANATEPGPIQRALAQTRDFNGVTGVISFDERGDVRQPAVTIFTYRGEERQLVKTLR